MDLINFHCFETFDHVILILAIWIKDKREIEIPRRGGGGGGTDPQESIILVDFIKHYI